MNAVNNSSSIYIGTESGKNAEGFDNIGIGRQTLTNLDNASENIAIGINAGNMTSSGSQNIFIGAGTGSLNTTGEKNTYLGWRAGYQNNGSRNVLIGYSANDQSYLGNDNTALGYIALHDLNDGTGNVAIGGKSLENIQTHQSLATLVSGNVYKIKLAGATDFTIAGAANNTTGTLFTYNGTPLSGNGQLVNVTIKSNYNTAVGFKAGEFVYQGSGNVFLGHNTGNGSEYRGKDNLLCIANSDTNTPLIGGNFATQELKIGGVQQFSVQYAPLGTSVPNGSIFYGTDGDLYFKNGSGTVTKLN